MRTTTASARTRTCTRTGPRRTSTRGAGRRSAPSRVGLLHGIGGSAGVGILLVSTIDGTRSRVAGARHPRRVHRRLDDAAHDGLRAHARATARSDGSRPRSASPASRSAPGTRWGPRTCSRTISRPNRIGCGGRTTRSPDELATPTISLAAYALDALDDDERERFERHLEECDECTEQLALLREPVAALAYAAEGPVPPEAAARTGSSKARAPSRARQSSAAAAQLGRWPPSAGVAAAAACLAIGLGIWANSLSNSLDQERSAKSALRRSSSGPARPPQPLIGADGSLLVSRTTAAPRSSSADWPTRRARRPTRPG